MYTVYISSGLQRNILTTLGKFAVFSKTSSIQARMTWHNDRFQIIC